MGKICENGQKVYAAYRVAKLLKIYEDCSPEWFLPEMETEKHVYERAGGSIWNGKNR